MLKPDEKRESLQRKIDEIHENLLHVIKTTAD